MRWWWGLLLLVSSNLCAVEENFSFDTPAQRALFMQLAQELRCPKCQNQNIADSDAMIATDLRRKLYQLVKQGKDREQILIFMKQRYGDFVHYQPPVNVMTIWLWLVPAGFVCLAVLWLVNSKKSVAQSQQQEQQMLQQAEQLLAKADRSTNAGDGGKT